MNLCRIRNLLLIAGALLLATSGFAQQNELNWTMERAIKQLDHQGEDFESMLAEGYRQTAPVVFVGEFRGWIGNLSRNSAP